MGMNSELMIVHYSVLALTVFVCTYLFMTVKRDLRVIETRYLRRGESLRTQLRELTEARERPRAHCRGSQPSPYRSRTAGQGPETAGRAAAAAYILKGRTAIRRGVGMSPSERSS